MQGAKSTGRLLQKKEVQAGTQTVESTHVQNLQYNTRADTYDCTKKREINYKILMNFLPLVKRYRSS